ncbi:hypothetical protein GGE50_006074 [Rhizobium leguminosarum]|uniref:hypothetical protein n=1 Tax=Rhizobium leguminosarum TaxID=384 RepID=UPI001613314F|nr:hypothetical protein [Rhizobium leguminosarum]MBB4590147.1 hypothetical protein [Rhizobium leguminosarum]
MSKIYLVTLRWIETPQNPEMIDALLAPFGDWIRWNGWTWFVSTGWVPSSLRAAIMARLKSNDSLIICELTPATLEGWAPPWVWDWFNTRWFPKPTLTPPPPPPAPTLGDLLSGKKPWDK